MIAIPICAKTTQEAVKKIKKGRPFADMFEIWLDRMKTCDMTAIKKAAKRPIIVVNKGKAEKGTFRGSEDERINRLMTAKEQGANFIDIGIQTEKTLIKKLVQARGKAKIIISYHDFAKTPNIRELEKIGEKAIALGANIIKIAVFPASIADLEKLLKIAKQWRKANQKYIIIGMGELGVVTRLFAPNLGSFFTYASLKEEEKTAPGQLSAQKLRAFRTVIMKPSLSS